ncbi:glycosyltransferase family 2 protein [Hysterangium stoloniferum]|nr:glycosyltransferase family 2 protein [Hysterangium stoloniferum]
MAHPHFGPARYVSSDVPIPTPRVPTKQQPTGTLRRGKTLTRPERGVAPVPLINPPAILPASASASLPSHALSQEVSQWSLWSIFAHVVTFWAPPFLLSTIGGLKERATRQAWREKIALCFIALVLGGVVGFATVGLNRALCPESSGTSPSRFASFGSDPNTLGIQGWVFNISHSKITPQVDFYQLAKAAPLQDITTLFTQTAANFPACTNMKFAAATDIPCSDAASCPLGAISQATFSTLSIINTTKIVGYDWTQVRHLNGYLVIDGAVLNLLPYFKAHPKAIANDSVDMALRTVLEQQAAGSGKDGTRIFYNRANLKAAVPCLVQRYYAGNIDKITPGCFVSQLFLYVGLVVILGLVLVRFAMACVFNWFMSARLVATPKNLSRTVISPSVLPEGANVTIDNKTGTAPWAGPKGRQGQKLVKATPSPANISLAQIGAELFTICLVTCYSEGEESIRTTLDSISSTSYSDARKLLFVVCDGMVTGAGEKRSTPDICVGLLEADPRFGNPEPMGYFAVGSGAKKENRAMVYAGHYTVAGRRTPTMIIVKCGTEAESHSDKKAGNRGKRDSQLILMNFFSRVTYNDRMTPLDFDMFRKIQSLMGVTADFFEVCLMVDADTKVYPDSLRQLVNSMQHDTYIMGVCGETRIANKRQSWVTAIQVYEYFISHHLAKAFESVFGGVTCLPGCFSMYRLKARKATGDDWVPILCKPEIVREYSQSEVTTLHQKNLLLLGEDRFLTTILLRTFPNRKMMFVPQARCRTVAPDTFRVLLSQRRRWINSTIHNLMELVLVRNLCGTFCFSMQFVVFMDLLGTVVLPVALSLTYSLIVNMAFHPPKTFDQAIPLMLLLAVIGLPGVLILITTRKVVYIFWMLIYLAALPIWNFVLPVYAFWHFDDFSWGATRKVEGEAKGEGHDSGSGTASGSSIPLRRWEDWERSRLRKIKREEKRRRDMARAFPNGYNGSEYHFLGDTQSQYDGSDTLSMASSEEDHWGGQVGTYNENGSQYPPPPPGLLLPHDQMINTAKTVDGDEMAAMLESGFDDRHPSPFSSTTRFLDTNGQPVGSVGYQLSDVPSPPRIRPYPPALRQDGLPPRRVVSPRSPTVPVNASSSAIEWKTHAKKRSGGGGGPGKYGPLGPLDPGGRI